MSLIDRIENITKLWGMLLPEFPKPTPAWIGRWCAYPDSAVERGLIRAAKKFGPEIARGAPDSELVCQYICGVARHEFESRERSRRHDDPASRW
jgi:hypothetical protein